MLYSLLVWAALILSTTPPVYGGHVHPGESISPRLNLADLSIPAQGAISSTLGRADAAYHFSRTETAYRANNVRHELQAEMRTSGVLVQKNGLEWGLSLRGYGYGEPLRKLSAVAPQADANRVEYRHDELTEWYENGPRGLQHGFTIEEAPGDRTGAPLTLGLALSGNVTVQGTKDALTLTGPTGQRVFHYRGLWSFDGRGEVLEAWFELRGDALFVRVDDAHAEYPVVIDPFIETVKLRASDGGARDLFGISVAVGGETIVVGATSHDIAPDKDQGAAYVFVKPASGWTDTTQSAKLTASDAADGDEFGCSVAISGETIVVGARGYDVGSNIDQGAAYVFFKPLAGWEDMTETAKLTAFDGDAGDFFGDAVAISVETIVVGAPFDEIGANNGQGSAYVFVKPEVGGSARRTAGNSRSSTARRTISSARRSPSAGR